MKSRSLALALKCRSHPLQLWARKAGSGASITKKYDEALGAPAIELKGPVPSCHICCPPDPEKALGVTLPVIVFLLKNVRLRLLDDGAFGVGVLGSPF